MPVSAGWFAIVRAHPPVVLQSEFGNSKSNIFPMLNAAPLKTLDPEIFAAISAELARQQSHIELIASENFTYPAVLEAQGSVLTNKRSEEHTSELQSRQY